MQYFPLIGLVLTPAFSLYYYKCRIHELKTGYNHFFDMVCRISPQGHRPVRQGESHGMVFSKETKKIHGTEKTLYRCGDCGKKLNY